MTTNVVINLSEFFFFSETHRNLEFLSSPDVFGCPAFPAFHEHLKNPGAPCFFFRMPFFLFHQYLEFLGTLEWLGGDILE